MDKTAIPVKCMYKHQRITPRTLAFLSFQEHDVIVPMTVLETRPRKRSQT